MSNHRNVLSSNKNSVPCIDHGYMHTCGDGDVFFLTISYEKVNINISIINCRLKNSPSIWFQCILNVQLIN